MSIPHILLIDQKDILKDLFFGMLRYMTHIAQQKGMTDFEQRFPHLCDVPVIYPTIHLQILRCRLLGGGGGAQSIFHLDKCKSRTSTLHSSSGPFTGEGKWGGGAFL